MSSELESSAPLWRRGPVVLRSTMPHGHQNQALQWRLLCGLPVPYCCV